MNLKRKTMDLTPKRAAIKMHYERCGVNYEEAENQINDNGYILLEDLFPLIDTDNIAIFFFAIKLPSLDNKRNIFFIPKTLIY